MRTLILTMLVAGLGCIGSPASAQASRTWVSGVGDDVNPCSRTAPCKTFAGAISKTAVGGEINCLDPGGYGSVSITRSITIDCESGFASILAPGTSGVLVNGANVVVTLRNLTINGAGTGNVGVRVINGSVLNIENVTIRGFAASNGAAISIEITSDARVLIDSAVIAGNASGLRVRPTGGTATVMLVDSVISGNSGTGIGAEGNARLRAGGNTITGNATGVSAGGGGATIDSYGDNRLDGNGTDGAFTGSAGPRR